MTEKLQEFYEFASQDEELCKKVNGLKEQYRDRDALIRAAIDIAIEHGFNLSADDFMEETRELSEDELDNVAGGSTCGCFIGGGGSASGGNESTCICAVGGGGDMIFEDETSKSKKYFTLPRCVCALAGGGGDKILFDDDE